MASVVESALAQGIAGTRVLDAFAGSGALGIEMLSRGAAHATFFDMDKGAAALIKRNLAKMGCEPARMQVICGDVVQSAQRRRMPGAPFDLVLIDPPYALGTAPAEELLSALAARHLLADDAVVLFERDSHKTSALEVAGFSYLKEKRYGQTAVDVLQRIA